MRLDQENSETMDQCSGDVRLRATSPQLIGSVVCTPTSVVVGESMKIDVLDVDGNPYNNCETCSITINGVPGSSKYLQFERPGTQRIHVHAGLPGQPMRQQEVVVQVYHAASHKRHYTLPRNRGWRVDAGVTANNTSVVAQAAFDTPGMLRFHLPEYEGQYEPLLPAKRAVAALKPPRATRIMHHLRVNEGTPRVRIMDSSRRRIIPADTGEPAIGIRRRLVQEAPVTALTDVLKYAPRYEWQFGDGTSITTANPSVTHDYTASLPPDREYAHFNVSIKVHAGNRVVSTSTRTVSVLNLYAFLKSRGMIHPRTRFKRPATQLAHTVYGRMTIYNTDAFPLHITGRRVLALLNDADDSGTWLDMEAQDMTIAPAAKKTFDVHVSRAAIPVNAVRIIVHYDGNARDGDKEYAVYASAYFDLPPGSGEFETINIKTPPLYREPWPWELVTNPQELVALDDLVQKGLISPEEGVTSEQITRLALQGHTHMEQFPSLTRLEESRFGMPSIDRETLARMHDLAPDLFQVGSVGKMQTLSGDPHPSVNEGEECTPENLPDIIPENFACQLTAEKRWTTVGAQFVNARKGDIVLSQGGPAGLIGGLLRQVKPAQKYAHCGIMTRNFDEITHSTASMDWLLDHPVGALWDPPFKSTSAPSDGLEPNALKYLWPGIITQAVSHAVDGQWLKAPDNGKDYRLGGFSEMPEEGDYFGSWEVVPPLVVKPDPMKETPGIRAQLKKVANIAAGEKGKSHYRFYCYTDPTIGLSTKAPSDAGWAAGTYPSVCSSFIWQCLKKSGVKLEGEGAITQHGDLEPADVAPGGAQVNAATQDGLYLYTGEERRAAANWLFEKLQQDVTKKLEASAGELAGTWDFFSDIAEDVANQVVNTFASDWSDEDAKDSEKWRGTGEANAVSPDNIMLWDSPTFSGLYGHLEPLRYQPAEYRQVTIYRWKKVKIVGTLNGQVLINDKPAEGVAVDLYDGKFTVSGADGRFTLTDIPVGAYEIKASKYEAGIYFSLKQPVTIVEGAQNIQLHLKMPPEFYRKIRVEGTLYTVDGEWPGSNETHTLTFAKHVLLGPWKTHDAVSFVDKVGGEVRSELHVTLDLDATLNVHVNFTARLFEGGTTETDELEMEKSNSFDVPRDSWGGWSGMKLVNNDTVDDELHVNFTVWNEVY